MEILGNNSPTVENPRGPLIGAIDLVRGIIKRSPLLREGVLF
jgi:hypothetical protein